MIRVAVNCNSQFRRAARYVMSVVGDIIGVSVRFVDEPGSAHVVYGADEPSGEAVWVPAGDTHPDQPYPLSPQVLGLDDDRELGYEPFDWVRPAWSLLSQAEQRSSGRRDVYGRFLASYSALPGWVYDRPIIQEYAGRLADQLVERFGPEVLAGAAPRWPDDRPFAVCLTHDVDVLARADPLRHAGMAVRGLCGGGRWMVRQGLRDCLADASATVAENPYANWDQWLEYEGDLGIDSTWFFICRPGFRWNEPRHHFESSSLLGRCVRSVVAAGQEIALHPWTDTLGKPAKLAVQRAALERVGGRTVLGSRQHALLVDTPHTWDVAAQVGLSYDASFGWTDRPGYRCGLAWPFVPYCLANEYDMQNRQALLELPLAVMDGSLFDEMKLAPDQAYQQGLAVVEQAQRVGGLAVVLWHPHTMYEREFGGWFEVLQRLVDWAKQNGAWMPRLSEVVGWWHSRREIIARQATVES